MSAKKSKRKQSLSRRSFPVPVYAGEVLRTYDFPIEPHDPAVRFHAMLFKYMFIEDRRILGRRISKNSFETVLGFADQASADRIPENIKANLNIDIEKWAVPYGSESTTPLEPIGYFFSREDNELIGIIVASDPNAVQAYKEGIAERMHKEGRDEGYIFRDLSEEEYNKIRAAQEQKAN